MHQDKNAKGGKVKQMKKKLVFKSLKPLADETRRRFATRA
jgi:hypothetical protein